MLRTLILLLALSIASVGAAAPPTGEGYIQAEEGVRLYYDVVGRGETVLVVVHGGPGNSHMSIKPDLGPLAERYTVIYYDQRGNGRSSLIDDPRRLTIGDHVRDLERLRQHFGLERMNLFGNSWGGLLVGAYAAEHPDRVGRLIFHSSAPPTFTEMRATARELSARADRLLTPAQRRRLGQGFDSEYRATVADPVALCREWAALLLPLMAERPEQARNLRGDICFGPPEAVRVQQSVNAAAWESLGNYDLRARMAAVTAPALIIHGVSDYITAEGSRQWARSLPNGRLLLIEGAGHLAQAERPEILFPAVEAFLAGRWPEGARPVPAVSERSAPRRRGRSG